MRLLLFTFLLSALSFGQDRNGISYQALIINPNVEQLPGQDNDHSPLTNTDICLQFHIINSSGNYEYSESQSVTTDSYGMINLVIGTGTPIGAITWDAVAWSAEAKSLRVDIDFSATCTGFSLLSNQKLNFSPYSYYALYSNADAEVSRLQDIVNTNETASNTADATLQTNIDAVQADVDANETAANTAIAAVQADVDANETASNTADATLQTNIDAVQADVDANEAATDAIILATINGVGLSSNGNYVANSQTNYINQSTSVVDATEDLDSKILMLQDLIDALVLRVETLEALHVPEIFLTGDINVNIEAGSVYTDAGATAQDLNDGDISSEITVSGTVDTSILGVYTLLYDVTDSDGNEATQVTRTINVVDTTAPLITLLGDAIIYHEKGNVYTDAGATANDSYYGDITSDIVVINNVNIDVAGTYTITYNVSDESNNAATQITRTVNVAETNSYTPAAQSGSGNFQESKYFLIGNTYFVFGNFSNADLDSPIKINVPTETVFSNSNEVNGVISGYMMGMESVGGYIEAVPGTNHVNLSARGAHGMTFDTSGSYTFSYSVNSSGNSYAPSTVNGFISLSEANYEILGSTVFVNGNFSNGEFDFGMTADISIPTETVFFNSNEVNGVISGYMMGMESLGGYIEAVPGTSSVRLHVAGAHMDAFDSTGSFVFSYNIDNNASTYTPTLSGNGTINTINYIQIGEMIVVNGKFSNLRDGATISLPLISSNFTSNTEVSGMITAKDFESFGGYIESVPSSQQVRFKLRGAHGQNTAQDGSFYFIYKP